MSSNRVEDERHDTRGMGCAMFHVVYTTGYHLFSGGKALQALTEDVVTRMGDIVRRGQEMVFYCKNVQTK